MARRKQEVALQQEVETNEDWNELLNKEGLIVVDVYQTFGGPCKAIEPRFRTLKLLLGDDRLLFAIAKADTIDALEPYKGKCEPCFLFYAGRHLVASIRGANAPLILRTIQEQLNHENKVLKGEAERKPIKDPYVEQLLNESQHEAQKEDDHRQEDQMQHTMVVIKTSEQAKRDEIINNIKNRGYAITAHKEAQLNEEQVKEIYKDKVNSPQFEAFSRQITSNTSYVLVVTGEDVIKRFIHELDESNPESMKQSLSDDDRNILESSDNEESAIREIKYFFPELLQTTLKPEETPSSDAPVEQTIAILKPGVSQEKQKEIHALIKDAGFIISLNKMQQLTSEVAKELYKDHAQAAYFNDLITYMSSAEIEIIILSKSNAIEVFRDMMGPYDPELARKEKPNSLRAQFGETSLRNAVHGSIDKEHFEIELNLLFGPLKFDAKGNIDH